MKNFLKILSFSILTAFAVASCEEIKEPVEIHLNKEYISNLQVGASQTLVATVTPEGSNVKVVWTSADTGIATVSSEGVVTGVAPGTVDITAKADNSTATCKVVVTPALPINIELSASEIELNIGDKRNLEVTLTPSYAVAEDLVWESSDSEVAVVSDGVVTAVKEGEAVITVACNDGKLTASCSVKVLPEDVEVEVKVTAIEIDPKSVELEIGQQKTLAVNVTPAEAVADDLVWETSNSEVAIVSGGVVTAVKAGNATITAKCNDGAVSATCSVTVLETEVAPSLTSVVINADATDLQIGKTVALRAEYFPEGAVPTNVSWTVDKPDFAQIDQNGVITGKYAEKQPIDPANPAYKEWIKVTVTVIADGLKASYSLRVIPTQPESIEVDLPADGHLRVGQEWDFNPRVLPQGHGFGVTCSIMKPGDKFTADSRLSSDVPGTIAAQFAVANHENLVYESYRRNVSLSVIPYWVESVSIPETQEMEVGGSIILSPEFTSDVDGVQPSYKDVKWSSSDQSVASINEKTGEIVAHAAGHTTITVTTANDWSVPGGEEQKSATCVLTVKAADSGLNVGDYFYSDGTWSSDLQSGKTVVGVVFAKTNATAADPVLAKDFPDCTHGLVLGLTEYADQDFGSVSVYDGHGYYANLGYDASSIVDVEKQNGYGNSKAHRDLNASKADYVALFNAESGVIAAQTNAVATPSGASSWYVPSYKEMTMILANYDTVNAAIVSAGGMAIATPNPIENSWDDNRSSDWYWTSTIYGKPYGASYDHYKYAFDISKGAWTTSQQSFAKCKVRVVFAF